MADVKAISIIILKMNVLNTLIKKQRLLRPNYMLSTNVLFRFKETNILKVKRCKNIYHVNSNHKTAGIAILLVNVIMYFKAR